jgi:hypothetical protein
MICGTCSLSRHQHYCSLGSVRCGVAMTITVAAVAGLIVGLMLGATVAGLALTERRSRHWVVYLRLPEELHRRLREEATDHMCNFSMALCACSRLQQ